MIWREKLAMMRTRLPCRANDVGGLIDSRTGGWE